MFAEEKDLLSRREAQALLGVGKNTILKYIYDGYLPAFMLANGYRIKKDDLIEFIEKSSAYYR